MEKIQEFKKYLNTPRKAVLLTHFKPDADALGSALGLALYLKKKGHTARVITPSDYPDFISWMPGNKEVLIFQKDKVKEFQLHDIQVLNRRDLVINAYDFINQTY